MLLWYRGCGCQDSLTSADRSLVYFMNLHPLCCSGRGGGLLSGQLEFGFYKTHLPLVNLLITLRAIKQQRGYYCLWPSPWLCVPVCLHKNWRTADQRLMWLNPLKYSGIRWLHLKMKIIQCHPGLSYIFNFWHLSTLALRAECQSARMSEIKNVA